MGKKGRKEIRHTPIRAVAKDPPGSEGSRLTDRMYARGLPFCINCFAVLNTGQHPAMFAGWLWVVGIYAKVGKEKLFAAWTAAPAVWLDGNENSVNVVQGLRVIRF
jgi:hypothetical protein